MEYIQMNFKNDRSFLPRGPTTQTDLWSSDRRFYRVVVLCLGLLSVFLLAGLFIFNIHYHNTVNSAAAELSTTKANMTECLQDSKNKVSSLTAERVLLNSRICLLTAERGRLNDKISSLTEDKVQLKSTLSSVNREKERLDVKVTEMTKDLDKLESLTRKRSVGWTKFKRSFYFLSTESGSWMKGREDCQNKGTDLVVINSAEEQEFLSRFTNETAWIGLSDRDEEGTWKWIDGTPLTFKNWKRGEPNDGVGYSTGGEDCAEIVQKWNDLPCERSLQWICEKNV